MPFADFFAGKCRSAARITPLRRPTSISRATPACGVTASVSPPRRSRSNAFGNGRRLIGFTPGVKPTRSNPRIGAPAYSVTHSGAGLAFTLTLGTRPCCRQAPETEKEDYERDVCRLRGLPALAREERYG